MSEIKHTPGPWRVDEDLNVRGPSHAFGSLQGPGPLLAEVYGHGYLPERATAREANAYLIAAGPELLEGCRLASLAHPDMKEALRAVIAKAEGKP